MSFIPLYICGESIIAQDPVPLSRGLDVTLGFIRIRHIMLTKVQCCKAATKSHGHILLTKISVTTDVTKINVTIQYRLKIDER